MKKLLFLTISYIIITNVYTQTNPGNVLPQIPLGDNYCNLLHEDGQFYFISNGYGFRSIYQPYDILKPYNVYICKMVNGVEHKLQMTKSTMHQVRNLFGQPTHQQGPPHSEEKDGLTRLQYNGYGATFDSYYWKESKYSGRPDNWLNTDTLKCVAGITNEDLPGAYIKYLNAVNQWVEVKIGGHINDVLRTLVSKQYSMVKYAFCEELTLRIELPLPNEYSELNNCLIIEFDGRTNRIFKISFSYDEYPSDDL